MNNFQIRKATPEDTQTIFDLIYKLAVYEKLENDVITSVEELRTNIFEKRFAEVLIAEEDEKPVGLVWVAIANKDECIAQSFHFRFDRKKNICNLIKILP